MFDYQYLIHYFDPFYVKFHFISFLCEVCNDLPPHESYAFMHTEMHTCVYVAVVAESLDISHWLIQKILQGLHGH